MFFLQIFMALTLLHSQEKCRDLFRRPLLVTPNAQGSFVGREALNPTDTLFKYYQSRIEAINSFRQLPRFEWKDLEILRTLSNGGRGNLAIYLAQYRDEVVVIKVSNPRMRTTEAVLHEAKVLMELNKVNQGIEFLGFTETPTGEPAMITRYERGVAAPLWFQSYREIRDKIFISKEMIQQTLALGELLEKLGYVYTADMQLLFTHQQRVFLIDTEFFFKRRPNPEPINAENTNPRLAASMHAQMMNTLYLRQVQKYRGLLGPQN
ncbi:MAG: hypothetical protein K2Q26_01930 [Bdellovibrionales bacterium]|nr:hypothetical protein [Bdellovibrionales bacterium]